MLKIDAHQACFLLRWDWRLYRKKMAARLKYRNIEAWSQFQHNNHLRWSCGCLIMLRSIIRGSVMTPRGSAVSYLCPSTFRASRIRRPANWTTIWRGPSFPFFLAAGQNEWKWQFLLSKRLRKKKVNLHTNGHKYWVSSVVYSRIIYLPARRKNDSFSSLNSQRDWSLLFY